MIYLSNDHTEFQRLFKMKGLVYNPKFVENLIPKSVKKTTWSVFGLYHIYCVCMSIYWKPQRNGRKFIATQKWRREEEKTKVDQVVIGGHFICAATLFSFHSVSFIQIIQRNHLSWIATRWKHFVVECVRFAWLKRKPFCIRHLLLLQCTHFVFLSFCFDNFSMYRISFWRKKRIMRFN